MAKISLNKLQHIYRSLCSDFGLMESKNPTHLEELERAINSHLADLDTTLVYGHYRSASARLHYNLRTPNVVVTNQDDHVIAAYKASPAQATYILCTGRLS